MGIVMGPDNVREETLRRMMTRYTAKCALFFCCVTCASRKPSEAHLSASLRAMKPYRTSIPLRMAAAKLVCISPFTP